MPDKIIILRPKDDCADYMAGVQALGFEPIAEEILTISYTDQPLPKITPDTSVVFTSANGVRAFARLTEDRHFSVYAVGRNTADEARLAGFTQLDIAGGTAEDLMDLLKKRTETGLKSVFYVRGEDYTMDLCRNLAKISVNSTEFVGYTANLSNNLSLEVLKSLKNREIKAVLVFSKRGGAHFSDLVRQYGRENGLKSAQALCIGSGVVESLRALPFKEVLVAPTPDRYGMMSLLQSLPN